MSTDLKANNITDQYNEKLIERIERLGNVGHWRLDLTNDVVTWSKQIYSIHGLTPEIYTPSLESGINAYHPEDREDIKSTIAKCISNKSNFEFEKRIIRPNGEIRHVVSEGECELDEKGNVIALFGVFRDITDVKDTQERYKLAAQGSASAMWDWDVEKNEVVWLGNSYKVLGAGSNDDLPKTSEEFFENLLHPDDRLKFRYNIREHFTKHTEFNLELRVKKSNGEYIWGLVRAQALWNEKDRAIRLCGSLTDINYLKRLEVQLKQSNEDLEQFATIASHDLQQPLRSISGFLEILKENYIQNLDEQALEYIDFAINSASDMSGLITDLLEYSRLDRDEANFEKIHAITILEGVLESLENKIQNNEVNIIYKNLPVIFCDPRKIHRVFFNIIENAIKYKKPDKKPEIEITSEETNDEWIFKIQDNGIGFNPSKHKDLFLMFYRLHGKKKYSGTGVGLAICKKVIDLHNGRIWAESDGKTGSIFYFSISKSGQF